MVSPLIPFAFSQEKIIELENKNYDVKIEYGTLGKVILNQMILIHKLQYLRYFQRHKKLFDQVNNTRFVK
jgi:hypothetical protein